MRILMVSEDIPAPAMGGLARHALTLCRALHAAGHQVDLMGNSDFCLSKAGSDAQFDGEFFGELHGQFSGWKEMRLGMFMPPKRSRIAHRFARAILRRAASYDVIHYHGHLPNVAHYMPASVNFIQTRHDQGSDCLIHTRFRNGAICTDTDPRDCANCRSSRPNWLQRSVTAAAVKRFRSEVASGYKKHKTVFVSDQLRRNLERSFGVGKWGVTLHNFVDLVPLHQARNAAGTLALGGPLRIFLSGKLYPAKGIGEFLHTVCSRQAPHLRIDIAGDGEEEDTLRRLYASDHIVFHGWQPGAETLRMAAQAHAIVVPSVWEEPCATTVLEALMLGKTCFALRRGGTPELAIYASDPTQLHITDSMAELVDALLAFTPHPDYPITPRTPADAHYAAQRLLALYRRAPGSIAH